MSQWKITIVWYVDGRSAVQADAEFTSIECSDDPLEHAMLVAGALRRLDAEAHARLNRLEDGYDERKTTILLTGNGRSRSLTVRDTMFMPSKDAERCAHQVMEWLTAEETADLLLPSRSRSRRR
jgi:hypothetical protein